MANNRELSQFGSFVSVNDTTQEISIASTITQVNANNLNVSGVSTLGIVSSLYVTGITTVGFLNGTNAYFTGIVTANFVTLGVTGFENLQVTNLKATGVTTLGVTSATNLTLETLKVSGISTFTNGPVLIGSGTSTGTALQRLQVTGGAYVSGDIGIGTITPKSKLHVQGDTLVTGGAYVSGNIGIGTTIPQSTLHVIGNTLVSGIVTATSFVGAVSTATNAIGGIGSLTQLQVTGISTFTNGPVLIGAATSTGTTLQRFQVTGGAYVSGGIGIGTTTPKSKLHVQGDALVTGVSTLGTVQISSGIVTATSGIVTYYGDGSELTGIKASFTGVSTDSTDTSRYIPFVDVTSGLTTVRTSTGLVYNPFKGNLGIGTTNPSAKLQVQGDLLVTGVSTLGLVKISTSGSNGIITATSVGSTVFYYGDGSGLTNIPSTAFTGEVGLGTNTYGDYVKNITGTANEIEVSITSGEGVSPQIGLPNNVTITTDLTIGRDAQVNRNLNVNGNITVGGTSAYLIVNNLQIKDKDIILGIVTNVNGNDISTDLTADHGGIAIASTEGTPLVSLQGIGNSIPDTYKQIMWLRKNPSTGLGTDAWVFNYGVGIGSTQVADGVRLAVGKGITMSDDSIAAAYFYGNGSGLTGVNATSIVGVATIAQKLETARNFNITGDVVSTTVSFDGTQNVSLASTLSSTININTSGIITATKFVGNLTGTATTATDVIGGIASVTSLKVNTTGISTLGTVQISSGIVTATSGIVTYYGDGSKLTGIIASAISGGSSITISANNDNQTQYLTFAPGAGTTTGLGIDTNIGLVYNPSTERLGIATATPSDTLDVNGTTRLRGLLKDYNNSQGTAGQLLQATSTGVSWINVNAIGAATTINILADNSNQNQYLTYVAGIGDTTLGISTTSTALTFNASTGNLGIGTATPSARLHVQGNALITGVSTLGTVQISSGIVTATSGIVTYYGDGSKLSGILGSAISGGSSVTISANNNNQTQYLTFAPGAGTTTGLGIDTNIGLVYNPSTERLGIATATPSQSLHVQGTVRITGGLFDSNNVVGAANSVLVSTGAGISWATASLPLNNSPTGVVYPVSSASTVGAYSTAYTSSTAFTFTTSTGTLSATQFTSLSDVNKKKNIRTIENAIDITKKLEGVRFDWIDTGASSIGVIAQEVEKVLPELVEETDGVKSVSYGNIIGVLIEAIKEQQVRIEKLEGRS